MNISTATMLDTLNTLRTQNGKKPLKSFKESRAKLEQMINAEANAFQSTPAELAAQTTRTTRDVPPPPADTSTDQGTAQPAKTAALRTARKENERLQSSLAAAEAAQPSPSLKRVPKADTNKQRAAKQAKKQPVKQRKSGDISAAAVLKELGINPKLGRAQLRKHNVARTADAIRAFFKK